MDVLLSLVMQSSLAMTDWQAEGEAALQAAKDRQVIEGGAKNVILFIADGMDTTTSTAARILAGQKAGGAGEEYQLHFDRLPFTGFSKTYNTNAQVPDSAGTATAMMTGHKTKAGMISIDQTVAVGDCEGAKGHELPSVMSIAEETGRATGIVSTARITHATPATVYAHSAQRGWEADRDLPDGSTCTDIASQLIEAADENSLWVALGGGRRNFLPNDAADPEYPTAKGVREDGRNLMREWSRLSRQHKVVTDAEGLANAGRRQKVLGLFEPSHMKYEHDRPDNEPSIADMTAFAIKRLSANKDGYFLLVEGGRVDHAHHGGNAYRALTDTIAFDQAVKTAMDMTEADDTLIIVTADHGHTMTFAGYPYRGNPIMGLVKGWDENGGPSEFVTLGTDKRPYTTLGYANGPGAHANHEHGRPELDEDEVIEPRFKQQSLVPLPSETHGGQDVAIYARGPGAHYLTGVHEQSFIFYVMKDALTRED